MFDEDEERGLGGFDAEAEADELGGRGGGVLGAWLEMVESMGAPTGNVRHEMQLQRWEW